MGDQLEQFILNNKDSFDDQKPSTKVWNQVEKKLHRPKTDFQLVWKIAAMIFMVSTIYLLIDGASVESEGPQLTDEFIQAENYYTSLISLKRNEIRKQLTPEEEEEFLLEVDQLDELYNELKKTYQANAANERVLNAMISNLQLRLEILNKQLEIFENLKGKNHVDQTNNEI